MTAYNIAMVFTPCLIRPKVYDDNDLLKTMNLIYILQLMIENPIYLFLHKDEKNNIHYAHKRNSIDEKKSYFFLDQNDEDKKQNEIEDFDNIRKLQLFKKESQETNSCFFNQKNYGNREKDIPGYLFDSLLIIEDEYKNVNKNSPFNNLFEMIDEDSKKNNLENKIDFNENLIEYDNNNRLSYQRGRNISEIREKIIKKKKFEFERNSKNETKKLKSKMKKLKKKLIFREKNNEKGKLLKTQKTIEEIKTKLIKLKSAKVDNNYNQIKMLKISEEEEKIEDRGFSIKIEDILNQQGL